MVGLSEISLPNAPTKAEVEKYIDAIIAASKKQTVFKYDDKQITMLAKVGNKYLPLLISRITNGPGSSMNFHLSSAIISLAQNTDKKLIIKMLRDCPALVSTVNKFGWQEDVRDIIFSELKKKESMPTSWIVCAGELASPKDYEILIKYFAKTHDILHTYNSIKKLPGIKLDATVATIWEKRNNYRSIWMRKGAALIAVDFGYLNALKIVIDMQNDKNNYLKNLASYKIHSLTGMKAPYAIMKRWFAVNRNKLFFDRNIKRYIIK